MLLVGSRIDLSVTLLSFTKKAAIVKPWENLMPVLPSYRNQSIDLLFKSTDWFMYEGNTDI